MSFSNHYSNLFVFAATIALAVSLPIADSLTAQDAAAPKITFDDHIKPIFMQRCSSCHNPNKKSGDLDVTNMTNLMQGGGSGEVIEAGDPSSSYLYLLVTHEESPEMPPGGTKIPDAEIKLLENWINGGALENKSSVATIKPKLNMAMSESPLVKPTVVPMPPHLPLEPVIKTAKTSAIRAIATSPWAPIAAISSPKQLLLYNTQSLELAGVLPLPEGQANSIRFSRNGSLLIAAGGRDGGGGKVSVWDVTTGEMVTQVGDEIDTILAADISPDHSMIALGGPQKMIRVYSTEDGSLIYEVKKHTDWVTAMEFSPDGKYLATGDRNGGLFLWLADSGDEFSALKGHTNMISGVSWRPDGKVLASGSEDTTIKLWEPEEGKLIRNIGAHGGGLTSLEFTREGNILSAGRDRITKLWKQDGGMIRQATGLSDVAVSTSYCDESGRFITGDWTGLIRVWNSADAKHLGDLSSNPPKLAERLAAATQALNVAKQKHQPLVATAQQTQTTFDQMVASLNSAKEEQNKTQLELTAVINKLAATKKQLESTEAQHSQWKKELTEKSTAKPHVVVSRDKAAEAVKVLPADTELPKMVASLTAKITSLDARVAELNQLVAKSDQEKSATEVEMKKLDESQKALESKKNAVATQITQMQSQMNAVTEKLKTDKAAVDVAAAEVKKMEAQAAKWQGEIAFVAQLAELKTQLEAARQVLEQKMIAEAESKKQLDAVKTVFDQRVSEKNQADQSHTSIEQKILQLKGVKNP